MENNEREMVKGSWSCAKCGKEITELPFEPAEGRPVHCQDCWKEEREGRRKNFGGHGGQREMVKGSWSCAKCGKEITELPFKPSGDRPLHCRDCWQEMRN